MNSKYSCWGVFNLPFILRYLDFPYTLLLEWEVCHHLLVIMIRSFQDFSCQMHLLSHLHMLLDQLVMVLLQLVNLGLSMLVAKLEGNLGCKAYTIATAVDLFIDLALHNLGSFSQPMVQHSSSLFRIVSAYIIILLIQYPNIFIIQWL